MAPRQPSNRQPGSPRTSACDTAECAAWFAGRLPDDWYVGPLEVLADKDEIVVIGPLAAPGNAPEGHEQQAALARITAFREETRAQRMAVAEAAQQQWQRTVSWAVRCGELEARFTTQAVPVMTRLRMEERQILDTLIDAGVVRSRSEALAWCVGQVGLHQQEWIGRLREAMSEVERVRAEGPTG